MFEAVWTEQAQQTYTKLRDTAAVALVDRKKRKGKKGKKASRAEGLFKQVHKCIRLLLSNPRHPGLQTHVFHSLINPYDNNEKVFEAYVQQHTPGAYRLFWCYGPKKKQITIIAITPHP